MPPARLYEPCDQPFRRRVFTAHTFVRWTQRPHQQLNGQVSQTRTGTDAATGDSACGCRPTTRSITNRMSQQPQLDQSIDHAHQPPICPRNIHQFESVGRICALMTYCTHWYWWSEENQPTVFMANEFGQLWIYDPYSHRISMALVGRELYEEYATEETPNPTSSSSSMEVDLTNEEEKEGVKMMDVTDIDSSASTPIQSLDASMIVGDPSANEEEMQFRLEMAKNDLACFQSHQPILELQLVHGIGGYNPYNYSIDLIHVNSITRIVCSCSGFKKHHVVPRIVSIRTVIHLPLTTKIVSCTPFPQIPRSYKIQIGPYLVTQPNSSHICLVRPGSTQLKIIVKETDFESVILESGLPLTKSNQSPMLTLNGDYQYDHEEELVWVLTHGYIFQLEFDPIQLKLRSIRLVIGCSPHTPNQPFFRLNSNEYRLQEVNKKLYVLDRMEGCVAQFNLSGELEQCIQPESPEGNKLVLPITHFHCNGWGKHSVEHTTEDIFLLNSSVPTGVIHHWSSAPQHRSIHDTASGRLQPRTMAPIEPLQLKPNPLTEPLQPWQLPAMIHAQTKENENRCHHNQPEK